MSFSVPYTFVANTTIDPTQVNANFSAIVTAGNNIDASQITTGHLLLAQGGTSADLSATGGAHQFLRQNSVGAGITVMQPATTDLSDATAPTGWTPGIDFGGGTTGITYSLQAGSYVKIGKLVVAQFQLTLTSKGSSTGTAHVTGLPVAAAATPNLIGLMTLTGTASMVGSGTFFGQISPGLTTASLAFWGSGTNALSDANFTNTTGINGTAIYISA